MCNRFLKLNLDNDESEYLALNHPNAFLLLYFIARRARRIPNQPDGLLIGQCHIGDWNSYGLTEQQYRTAKQVLCTRKIIKIIETCRTRKKSTTGVTTRGTLVELLDSKVWDINPETINDRINDRPTTDQRPTNDEEERRRISISKDIDNKEDARSAGSHPAPPIRSKDLLSFNFQTWQFEGITDIDRADWQSIYKHINLESEITKASQWLKSNPSKSDKKLWRKFLTGWLQRANDSIENKKAFRTASGYNSVDRRTKDISGNPVESPHTGRF